MEDYWRRRSAREPQQLARPVSAPTAVPTRPGPRRRGDAPRYALRPLSETTQVPWAAVLRQQHSALASTEDGALALEFLTTGLAAQTATSYDGKLNKFITYCAVNNLVSFPASQDTILRYGGHLASLNTISVESIQPYFSCINTAHVQLGLAAPALGPLISHMKKGWRQRQVTAEGVDPDKRIPLPADVMRQVLDSAVHMVDTRAHFHGADALAAFRDCVALLVTYLFFGRSDTGHAAAVVDGTPDLQVSGDALYFYERKRKGRAAGERKRTLTVSMAHMPELRRVVCAFTAVAPCTNGNFWQLPTDRRVWTATVIDDMLQRVLQRLGVTPPLGYTYTSHSLRAGAASAAFSIDVSIIRICFYGGWAQGSQAVYFYIDPSWGSSPAAVYFFGHLRH